LAIDQQSRNLYNIITNKEREEHKMRKENVIPRSIVEDLYKWNKGDISQAYGKPSDTKVEIYNDIAQRASNEGGYDLCVRSRNCHFFTTMYRVKNGNTEYLVVDYPTRTERLKII